MVIGKCKNLCVFKFTILLNSWKFDAREIYVLQYVHVQACIAKMARGKRLRWWIQEVCFDLSTFLKRVASNWYTCRNSCRRTGMYYHQMKGLAQAGQRNCHSQVTGSSPGWTPLHIITWASYLHLCASVTKHYNLVLINTGDHFLRAWWKVTAV